MIKTKEAFTNEELAHLVFDLADASYPHGSPWTKEQWQTDVALPHSQYFLWEDDGQVLGFLACHLVLSEIEIMQVAVHPAHQKKGLAQQLIQTLTNFAQKSEVDSIFLEVRESNHAAKQAYEKNGFEAIGVRKNYYYYPTENAVIMLKKVR